MSTEYRYEDGGVRRPADFEVTVYGRPGPQGSKSSKGGGRMVESSEAVKPWRDAVTTAAVEEIGRRPGFQRLDGPLSVSLVLTVGWQPAGKPTWWPKGLRWSKSLRWRPASAPDLSKLLRATEDALTDAGVWKDDARVAEYVRLGKHYVGGEAADVLPSATGAVVRIWRLVPPPQPPEVLL